MMAQVLLENNRTGGRPPTGIPARGECWPGRTRVPGREVSPESV